MVRSEVVLEAERLARTFTCAQRPMTSLREASLRVHRGEMVAVLGRSGSGKSSLLALCGGLDHPDRGRVVVAGHDLAHLDEAQRDRFLQRTVGWVFQSSLLVPLLTAAENVALALRIAGEPEAEIPAVTEAALEAVGLLHRAHRRATHLSLGEQQRVSLARALAKTPLLLVADEPTAQLDSQTSRELLGLLRDAANADIAVLLATHDEAEAAEADRVVLLEDGVLVELG
jgi:putative ABC transport system ATP-binding protein